MVTFLTGGITTRIEITSNNNYDVIKNKNEIVKELNKSINITNYDIREYSNRIELIIKKDIFENNIHTLIKKLNKYMNISFYFFSNLYNKNIPIYKFNKKNYPIFLNFNENGEIYLNDTNYSESICKLDYSYMLLKDSKNDLSHKVKISIKLINIWCDRSNASEYPLGTIDLLNKLFKNNFTNPLGQAILFYIN